MAEPIWSKIEENVSGDDYNGVVSDVITDYNTFDHIVTPSPVSDNPKLKQNVGQWDVTQGHVSSGHLHVPDKESNSPLKQNDEYEVISSRIFR